MKHKKLVTIYPKTLKAAKEASAQNGIIGLIFGIFFNKLNKHLLAAVIPPLLFFQ